MRIRFYLRTPDPSPEELARRKAEREINPDYKHPKNKRKDLASPKAQNTRTAIYAMIHYDGNQVRYFPGETIVRKYWNPARQQASNSSGFPQHPEFNERLNQIKNLIEKTYLGYKNKHGGQHPAPKEFVDLLDRAFSGKPSKITLFEYFQDYIDRTINGQRINPKSKKPIRESGVRGYQTTLAHLKAFAAKQKRNLDFDSITLEFYKDFNRYLSAAPNLLSLNTIGSHTQRLKAVLAEATETGHNSNMAFKSRYFIKQSEEADTIYLNEDELKAWQELDLSAFPALDAVRDLFTIACNTGLRHSDWAKLKTSEISGSVIKIKQEKTDAIVEIPIRKVVLDIIEKHGGDIPKVISNQKTNDYLKLIGQKIDCLKTLVEQRITRGDNEVIILNKPKWELLTTHTARRSFATNEFKAGTPSLAIMAITGHKTEKSFLKYIRISPNEHAKSIAKIWADRDAKAKLKAV